MMSCFLPNATMRPFCTMATRSTATSALGRCAITIVMPPRALMLSIARVRAASPSPSRFELGSSMTMMKGLP